MSKVFVDTNILVYSMDKHDLQKWTEDLNTGQVIRGVKIVNPFKTT